MPSIRFEREIRHPIRNIARNEPNVIADLIPLSTAINKKKTVIKITVYVQASSKIFFNFFI
jgi:hypothetical protein